MSLYRLENKAAHKKHKKHFKIHWRRKKTNRAKQIYMQMLNPQS